MSFRMGQAAKPEALPILPDYYRVYVIKKISSGQAAPLTPATSWALLMRSEDPHQRTCLLALMAPFYNLWHESLICAERRGEPEAMTSDCNITTLKRAAAFYEKVAHAKMAMTSKQTEC